MLIRNSAMEKNDQSVFEASFASQLNADPVEISAPVGGNIPPTPPVPTERRASRLNPGDLLAERFRINRFIARGGMGEVYEAEDLQLNIRVALKTVLHGTSADLDRLKLEVQLAREVSHPNVCRIFDISSHKPGAAGESPLWFITMELLEGRTLSQEIAKRGKFNVKEARPIVEQTVAGLGAIHSAGIVHGDFKSGNIILVERANHPTRVVITDFGLARNFTGPHDSRLSGVSGGTPLYMAPEQVRGDLLTPRTDVYALGVVLYEMVTGHWPFRAETPEATARKRLTEAPTSPIRYVPDLDPVWSRAILRCLALEPAERFPSALDLRRLCSRRLERILFWHQVLLCARRKAPAVDSFRVPGERGATSGASLPARTAFSLQYAECYIDIGP